MVVAGHSWVVGILIAYVCWGVGVLVRMGIPWLVRHCRCLVVCHIGGNDVAPGTEQ